MPYKEDVSYCLEEGGTAEELLNIIKNTPPMYLPPFGRNASLLGQVLSDVGNAERLIALYGSIILYVRDGYSPKVY